MVEEPAIALDRVTKHFSGVHAVNACTLRVPRGAFVSLLGPSGCGKTTLLRMIAGFEAQDAGAIRVHGDVVDGLPPNKREVNTVFQRYALFPHKTVGENVAFPLEVMRVPKAERRERVREMLDMVHLRGVDDRGASQLSGGQAQRVALARALVGRPKVLLLDEPLAALDLKLRQAMQLELRRIQEEVGATFLYVTHDQQEALTMSDSVVLMDGGEIVQQGSPEEIYERPTSVFVSQFIGEANLLRGRVARLADEAAFVSVATFTVVVPSTPGMSVGDPAVLSIRPERLGVHSGRSQGAGERDNQLAGVVRRRIYLGHLARFMVEVAPGVELMIEQSATIATDAAVGASVMVVWPMSAVVVIPHE
jgi:spermidine/putrescine transport system ATP-binding protein